jgi:hypothetical protein
MSKGAMLRFTDEQFEQYSETSQARRERFQAGKVSVPEREILAASIELLQKHPSVAWAKRANAGCGFLLYADTYKRLVAAGHLKPNDARFMRFGIPGQGDITGMLRGGKRLEIECKSDRGKLRDDQVEFGQAVNGGGGLYIVVRSVDELVRGLA